MTVTGVRDADLAPQVQVIDAASPGGAKRSGTDRAWLAALLFALLTVLLTWPMALRPHDRSLPVDPDRQLFMWTLAWNTHAAIAQPLAPFDANIYHPEPRTLAYSENLLGSTVFAAPVLWLTGNPLLAMNAVSLLSCVLCALGAYLLARRLGMSRPAAAVCGIVFAFSPARLFRIGQLHLTTIQWMPFSLAFLHAYLDERRPRDLKLAVFFFTAQVLTSGHGGVFLAIAVAALLAFRLLRGEPPALRSRVRHLGLSGALLLVPVVLMALPYRQVQAEMGLRRSLENWETTPESFLASPTHLHVAIARAVLGVNPSDTATAHLFVGYLPIALAAVALWPALRRRAAGTSRAAGTPDAPSVRGRGAVPFYALLAALAILLAAGPPIGLWPYVYWLPGFNFIRVPSRFMLLGVLAISVLAGFGFDRLAGSLRRARRLAAAALVTIVLAAEFSAVPFALEPHRVRIPAVDRWLALQPKPFVVAELPVLPSERYQTAYMLHATAHWQKTIHGYSGIRPPLHEELYAQLRSFPDDRSVARLRELGVTYVVVHADMYPDGAWAQVARRLNAFHDRLQLVYAGGDGRVYSLR